MILRLHSNGPQRACRRGRSFAIECLEPRQLLSSGADDLIQTSSREAVVAAFEERYQPALAVQPQWTGDVATCNPGTVDEASTAATLQMINYFRGMAGLPGVTLDPVLSEKALQAALMMQAANQLSHSPSSDWKCYTAAGAEAAGHSNLYLGVTGPAAIAGYVQDPGSGNTAVGHRRWILYPRQTEMGSGSTSRANALWVLSDFGPRPSSPEWVAWPPAGYVPYQTVYPRWSLSKNDLRPWTVNLASATVEMRRGSEVVPVQVHPVVNGYGDNTLVWEPQATLFQPSAPDTTYQVTVSGIIVNGVSQQHTYEVTIVDPSIRIPDGTLPAADLLVAGVSQIVSPGSPGPVYDMSGNWTPIVGGDADSSFPATFALARPYDGGRIVAFGHEGIFGAVETLDNGVFLENVTRWLDASGGRQVGYTTGHGEWVRETQLAGLAARLAGGYSFTALPGEITAAALSSTSVLIVGNAWQDFTAAEIEAVRQFVAAGGGLWLIGLGWSWEPYHPGTTIEDYPMMELAAPYEVRWLQAGISDPTHSLDGAPVFHTFYPDVPTLAVADALAAIRAAHAAHPADLPAALESDSDLRVAFVQAHQALSIPATEFPEDHAGRGQLFDALSALATDFPASYARTAALDQTAYPTATWVRERFWRTWRDCLPLTAEVVATLIGTGQLSGNYANVLQQHGVVLLDNLRLGAAQVGFIDRYLDAVPAALHNLRSISVLDYLGTRPEAISLDGQPGAVNVFGIAIGGDTENPFPDDVTPILGDVFAAVLAHEVNHVVDAYTIGSSAALDTRRDQLVAEAGAEPLNYLRSMFPAGFFAAAPQEFFASISNQWFVDSAHAIELGLARFDAGRRDPINQALLFAEVYSQGGSTTQLYRIGLDGSIAQQAAALGRDGQGRIQQLTVGDTVYRFTLDAAGNVTAYTAVGLISWQNPDNRYDVSGAGGVTALDVLYIINWINSHSNDPSLPAAPAVPPPFYDVNGDDAITAGDVLDVVNYINSQLATLAEAEAGALPAVLTLVGDLPCESSRVGDWTPPLEMCAGVTGSGLPAGPVIGVSPAAVGLASQRQQAVDAVHAAAAEAVTTRRTLGTGNGVKTERTAERGLDSIFVELFGELGVDGSSERS